jgi:hypothetical protein
MDDDRACHIDSFNVGEVASLFTEVRGRRIPRSSTRTRCLLARGGEESTVGQDRPYRCDDRYHEVVDGGGVEHKVRQPQQRQQPQRSPRPPPPWRRPLKSTTRAMMLKNSQVTPQAPRASGTAPARKASSTSTVFGERTRSNATKSPKMRLTRRMIHPYLT